MWNYRFGGEISFDKILTVKLTLLISGLLLFVAPITLPTQYVPSAQAAGLASKAQRDAIDQWASVIRRCKTAKVMYEVVDLLGETIRQIQAAQDTQSNRLFISLLKLMKTAASLKAKGLDTNNQIYISNSEDAIRTVLRLAHGGAG